MYVVANRLQEADAVNGTNAGKPVSQGNPEEIVNAPGFIRMEIRQAMSCDHKPTRVVLTHWASKAAFEAWSDKTA